MGQEPFRLEPLGIVGVLRRTFQVYAHQPRPLLAIYGLYALATRIVALGLVAYALLSPITPGLTLVAGLLSLAILCTVWPLMLAALTRACADIYIGREVEVGTSYRFAWKRFWPVSNTLGLMVAIIGVLFIISMGLNLMAWFATPSSVLVLLTVVAAAIAALLTRWVLATEVSVLEDKEGRDALTRSMELVSGRFWSTLAFIAVVALVGFLLKLAGGLAAALVLLMTGAIAPGAPAGTGAGLVAELAQMVAGIAVEVLVAPIAFIAYIVFYYDLRVRKEGFDARLLAASVDGEGPPPAATSPAASPYGSYYAAAGWRPPVYGGGAAAGPGYARQAATVAAPAGYPVACWYCRTAIPPGAARCPVCGVSVQAWGPR